MISNIKIDIDSYSPVPLTHQSIYELALRMRSEYGRPIQQEMKHYLRIAEHIIEAFDQPDIESRVDIIKEPSIEIIISNQIDSRFRMFCTMTIKRNSIEIESIQISEVDKISLPNVSIILQSNIMDSYSGEDLLSYYHCCKIKFDHASEIPELLAEYLPKETQQNVFYHSTLFIDFNIPYIEPTISEFKNLIQHIFQLDEINQIGFNGRQYFNSSIRNLY
jgi:hypothetical protein